MPEDFAAIIKALPGAASNPLALVAYLATIASWTLIAFRVRRHGALLAKLSLFPEGDRLEAVKAEMGGRDLPPGMTPELYVRQRRDALVLYGVLAFAAAAVIIVAIAFFDAGKVSGSVGLYT
jgi:hypothetical protein